MGNQFKLLLILLMCIDFSVNAQCPNPANIDSLDQPTCTNPFGVVFLSGLPSGSWTITSSPAGITQSGSGAIAAIPGLTPGQAYSFDYTVASPSCTSTPTSIVNINLVPNVPNTPIAGGVTQPTCLLATGSVAISNLPTMGGWSITATSGTGATTVMTGLGSTYSFTGLAVGSYTFVVTQNSTGCSSASSNQIFINPPTTPSAPNIAAITQPSCAVPTGSVSLSGLPPQPWTITTNPGGLTTPGTGTSTVLNGLPANASYTFSVTNNVNSCTSIFSLSAAINSAPVVPVVPTVSALQPTCPIPSGTINVSSPLGAYTYSVNGINYQISPAFSGLVPGSYTINVQDNTSGCVSTSLTIVINPLAVPPVVNLLYVDSVSCFGLADGGAAVQIASGGTAPFVYSWSINATPVGNSNDTVTGLSIGNYNVVVVDAAQCVVVQSFMVYQPTALSISGDSTPVNCQSGILGTIDVDVTGGVVPYLYVWSNAGGATDSIGNLNIGSYSVNVTDNNGCLISYGTQIGIVNGLNVNIIPSDTAINPNTSFVANVYSLGNNFSWTPTEGLSCTNCPNPTVTPDSTIMYYVNVTDNNGCQGEDSMFVTVVLLCGEFFVPSIFSPNGTGPAENNVLTVFGKAACVQDFRFVIYDRWGEKVYEATDISQSWDGFFRGSPMQMGNYVYALNIQLYDDTIVNKSGSINLVR